MQARRPHRRLSRPAGWVALVAILIWSVLPAGVMPYGRGDGSVTLTLCTVDGPLAVVIGADGLPQPASPARGGGGTDDGSGNHAKQACPWSATQFVSAIGAPSVLAAARPVTAARHRGLPARILCRTGRRHRIGQPRAPPSLL